MDFWNLTLHFPSFTPTFDLSTIRFLGLPWALLSLLLFWAFFWIWRNLVLKARSSRSFRVWIAPLKQFGDLSEIWRRISMRCSYSNDIVVNKFSNRHLEHSTLGYSFNSRLLKWFFLKKIVWDTVHPIKDVIWPTALKWSQTHCWLCDSGLVFQG